MAFKESEHPRDADGKFVKGAGGSKDPDPEEIAKEIFPHLTQSEKGAKINASAKSAPRNNQAAEASIYVNSGDQLYRNASKIKPIPGYEDMVIHGGPDGVQLRDFNDEIASDYTAKDFAQILKEDPNYHGGNIRLISCSTGKGDECFAQQLADELGVSVMAPSDVLFAYPDGTVEIKDPETNKQGEWLIFKPRNRK